MQANYYGCYLTQIKIGHKMSINGFYPILHYKGKWAREQNLRKEVVNCRDFRCYCFYVSKVSNDLYLCLKSFLGVCKEVMRTSIFQ